MFRVIAVLLFIFIAACNRRANREMQKEQGDIKKTPVILSAKSTNPDYDFTLDLHHGNIFIYQGKQSGMKNTQLYAGSYEWVKDTLNLGYYYNHKPQDLISKAWIDTVRRQVIMLGKVPSANRHMVIQ